MISFSKVLIKKEFHELFFSVKGLFYFLVVSVILSLFSALLVTNTELSLLDNAQALYMISGIILALMMLISSVYGSDAIAGERERRTLETLLITPIGASEIALSKLAFSSLLYFLLFLIGLPYFIAIGSSGQNVAVGLVYLFFIGWMLSIIYTSIAIYISQNVNSLKNSMMITLAIVLISATPLIISPAMRKAGLGKVMDYLNPFGDAVNTLDSVIIDSEPF
ncbi:MAG TPA: ABC transporter, partial [Nitratifractor sp.]|nr:ABC transporter [Nitratifractor sp.]